MEKYKVKITKENFTEFVSYYNTDKKHVQESLELFIEECPVRTMKSNYGDCIEVAKKMFHNHFMNRHEWKDTFPLEDEDNKRFKLLIDYCADNNILWDVVLETKHFLSVNMSGTLMFWDKRFCTMVELPDYERMTMGELRAKISAEENVANGMFPAEISDLSISSANEEKDSLHDMKKELEKQKDDISYCRTEELQKLEEEIQKLKDHMYERKKELQAKIDEQMAVLNEKIQKLNLQIYIMESEIYTIRSYSGETIQFKKVRDGKKAAIETPLVVNQKLMYLDEDLARIVSIYQTEIAQKYDLFEDAVKYNDDVFESFCPQERCITFFRLSKTASYKWFNLEHNMYEREELIHGKKIGFILRDNECAYMGWMEESWRKDEAGENVAVTFTENLMYRPEKTVVETDADDALYGTLNDSMNTMLSRVFAMSVVQGILQDSSVLEFPEKVSIVKPGKYIMYNYASGWITDDRFGDFATLVENLNKRTKVKDQILICYDKQHCQGRGEVDRTHDCEVPEGVNRVNYLDSDEYGHCNIYVSAKKRWSSCGATANVYIRSNEYINITYMNSIWLSYYVQTKKMGSYAEDYAKMIKHFKRAIKILKDREWEEMTYIKKYFPEADQIPEWEIKLSHWKLNHNIRFINDFQAKRIAKYLQEGKFEENKHLFEKETFYNEDITAKGKYSETKFCYTSSWYNKKEDATEFENGSSYYMQNFYIEGLYTSTWLSERQKEENETKIATAIPGLEALVSERIELDKKKLCLVNAYVESFMNEHDVSVKELPKCPDGLTFNDRKLGFLAIEELDKDVLENILNMIGQSGNYPGYILQSECWKVAYYDFIHKQYGKILHDVKMILHARFMNETISV